MSGGDEVGCLYDGLCWYVLGVEGFEVGVFF